MKKKIKIITKFYKNGKLQEENCYILQNESLMMRIFFFLTLSPILIYLNLLYCFFYLLYCFFCFLKYFFEFILKAKNKLISIFNKN